MKSFHRFPARATFAVLAPLVGLLAASCGSSSVSPSSVYVTSTLGASILPGSTGDCNVGGPDTPFFTIGTEGGPVANNGGGTDGGQAVTVVCSVHPTGMGDTFDVNLQVDQGQTNGITIGGTLADSPGMTQTGLAVSFYKAPDSYSQSDCTVVLSTQGNPPITAGRVWGTVTCPMATYAEANATCFAQATFIFQNCGQ
jgi:hypothetical protein